MQNLINPRAFESDSWVLYKSVLAGSGDDGTNVVSAAIANTGDFNYLKGLVVGTATLTSEKIATIVMELHHCDTSGGSYTKFADFDGSLVIDATGSAVFASTVNCEGAKKFMKIAVKATLSATETDTFVYHAVATKQALKKVEA